MQLRLYQEKLKVKARKELRDSDSVCVVLPTGGGKTVIFCAIAKAAVERQKTVWICVHRIELVKQTCKALSRFGIPHGIIAPGVPETTAYVQVAMIQTLKRRLNRWAPPDLLITDECHHAPSVTYQEIIKHLDEGSKSLGFTATPERLDGKGLIGQYKTLVVGPQIKELIEMGWLVPPEVVSVEVGFDPKDLHTKYGDYVKEEIAAMMDTPKITGDVVKHYREFANGMAAVAFCVNVAHAQHVAEQFSQAGIPSTAVFGALDPKERELRLESFRTGKVMVLTSADLISEGFDLPKIEAAILLRPTRSLALYLQQVGRALRPDPENGKTKAIILDHVQNWVLHGLPDMERDWSLEGRTKRKKGESDEITCTTCKECFRVFEGKGKCPYCGYEPAKPPREEREIEQVEGNLVRIGAQNNYKDFTADQWRRLRSIKTVADTNELVKELNVKKTWIQSFLLSSASSLKELREVAVKLGFKPNWGNHIYQSRHGEEALKEALELYKKELIKGAEVCQTKTGLKTKSKLLLRKKAPLRSQILRDVDGLVLLRLSRTARSESQIHVDKPSVSASPTKSKDLPTESDGRPLRSPQQWLERVLRSS